MLRLGFETTLQTRPEVPGSAWQLLYFKLPMLQCIEMQRVNIEKLITPAVRRPLGAAFEICVCKGKVSLSLQGLTSHTGGSDLSGREASADTPGGTALLLCAEQAEGLHLLHHSCGPGRWQCPSAPAQPL